MIAKLFAFATLVLTATAFPLYKQCDSRWANDRLGTSSSTICKAGCLMSSVSMVIADCGKSIDGASATPKTLNSWLTRNGGYASGDLFVWGSVAKFGLSFVGMTSTHSRIAAYHYQGKAVILNVNNGGHWVLLTGISGSDYLVNDPGFARTSYPKSAVVTAGIFNRPTDCKSLLE